MSIDLLTKQQKLVLDFNQNFHRTVLAKQYDKNSRFIPIQCTDNGKPFLLNTSWTVDVKVLTPDNRALLENTAIIQSDGSILLEVTENMLYYPGKEYVEIVIYDTKNKRRLSPMNFYLIIESSVYSDDRIIDSDVFNSLTEYVFGVHGLYDRVDEHVSNKENPHEVTKEQVGLGNIPNVTTNDQTPTYDEEIELKKLSSGEKLSIAFGKISKAISDLIEHIGNNIRHITNDERDKWNTVINKIDKTVVASESDLGLIKSGTDITVDNSGNVSVNDNSHNHLISNITDLQFTLDKKADLDETGKILSNQLPSYVDDVLEGYASGIAHDESTGTITATEFYVKDSTNDMAAHYSLCNPETGKIYIDENTNLQYRWSGSLFVTTGSHLALGETASTAYRGDRGKIAYEHSQSENKHIPSGGSEGQILKCESDGTATWVDAPSGNVTGVKGNKESSYRIGDVNITPDNIGALSDDTKYAASSSVGGAANKISVQHGDEFNLSNIEHTTGIHINHRNADTDTANPSKITAYYFKNGQGSTSGVTLYADSFSGNVVDQTARNSAAKALSVANSKVSPNTTASFSALELSANAPFIDFHWQKDSSDYTSRIICDQVRHLTFDSNTLFNGTLDMNNNSIISANTITTGTINTQVIRYSNAVIHTSSPGGVVVANLNVNGYEPILAASFNLPSSRLIKENISPMSDEEVKKILDINVVDFDYKEQFGGNKGQHGVIAEEVIGIIPSCVVVPDGYSEEEFDTKKGIQNKLLSVDYSKFVPYLIKMVQMQNEKIDAQQQQINNLINKLE